MPYYLIEHRYVGPNQSDPPYEDYVTVESCPGRTNLSGAEVVRGWLGTTNDHDEEALGEFASLKDALACAAEKGYTHDPGEHWCLQDEAPSLAVREVWHAAYERWDASDYLDMTTVAELGISAGTSDEELEALKAKMQKEAMENGWLIVGLFDALKQLRDDV